MFEDVNSASLILSLVVGLLLGVVIGARWNRPRTWLGFAITLLLTVVSRFVMVSGYLFGSADSAGEMTGLNVSILLMCFFAGANLVFLYRRVANRPLAEVHSR